MHYFCRGHVGREDTDIVGQAVPETLLWITGRARIQLVTCNYQWCLCNLSRALLSFL